MWCAVRGRTILGTVPAYHGFGRANSLSCSSLSLKGAHDQLASRTRAITTRASGVSGKQLKQPVARSRTLYTASNAFHASAATTSVPHTIDIPTTHGVDLSIQQDESCNVVETQENQQQSGLESRPDFRRVRRHQVHDLVLESVQKRDLQGGLSAIEEFQQQFGRGVNKAVYNTLLNAAVKENNSQIVQQILNYFSAWSVPYDSVTYLCLLTWLGKTNKVTEAENLWQELLSKRPKFITPQIIGIMLTIVRKHKLGRSRLKQVLDAVNQYKIPLSTIGYRELFNIYKDLYDVRAFTQLYEQYMAALSQGEVQDHLHIWLHIIYVYSMSRPPGWLHVVSDAVQRAKHHLVKCISSWEYLVFSLTFTGNPTMLGNILYHIANRVGLTPTLYMFKAYCKSIYVRTIDIELSWWLLDNDDLTFLRSMKRGRRQIADRLPADHDVLTEWERLLEMSKKYDVPLDSHCYNYILAALARSRHYTEASKLLGSLHEKADANELDFTLNVYGYMALVILVTNRRESEARTLSKMRIWKARALKSPPSFVVGEAKSSFLRWYETLMCAYALLEEPGVTTQLELLVREMKSKGYEPVTLHRTLYAFELNPAAMDKLVKVTKQYWPSMQLDYRYYQPYFLICMMDMLKRGELSKSVLEHNSHETILEMKEKMKQALNMCAKVFDKLTSSIFLRWAQLLAYYGNDVGVRAVIALATEEEKSKSLEAFPEALPQYWMLLAITMTNLNKVDECTAILTELKATGSERIISKYNRLLSMTFMQVPTSRDSQEDNDSTDVEEDEGELR